MEVDKTKAIDVSTLDEGSWIWPHALLLYELSLSGLLLMMQITCLSKLLCVLCKPKLSIVFLHFPKEQLESYVLITES